MVYIRAEYGNKVFHNRSGEKDDTFDMIDTSATPIGYRHAEDNVGRAMIASLLSESEHEVEVDELGRRILRVWISNATCFQCSPSGQISVHDGKQGLGGIVALAHALGIDVVVATTPSRNIGMPYTRQQPAYYCETTEIDVKRTSGMQNRQYIVVAQPKLAPLKRK